MVKTGFQNFNFDTTVSKLENSYKFDMYPTFLFLFWKQKIIRTIKIPNIKFISCMESEILFFKIFC